MLRHVDRVRQLATDTLYIGNSLNSLAWPGFGPTLSDEELISLSVTVDSLVLAAKRLADTTRTHLVRREAKIRQQHTRRAERVGPQRGYYPSSTYRRAERVASRRARRV